MTFDELKNKAASLPMEPGVYIMYDETGTVIYVGKAKKLKNRVSQYFLDSSSHTPKTRMMVSKIHSFDVIVTSGEFEALVLECAQIKRYQPRYNILLKDDKGYPYIRLDIKAEYPRMSIAARVAEDGAAYFGPFGSRGITQKLIDTLNHILGLPDCSKVFPKCIGQGRPCLNYHISRCAGWCQGRLTQQEYASRTEQLRQLLSGNYREVIASLQSQMLAASEQLNFELAADIRDRMKAVEGLKQKQHVVANAGYDVDAIGFAQTPVKACFAVLHFSQGELVDKEYEILTPDDESTAVSSLVKQYYLSRGIAPRKVLLPFSVDDSELFSQMLFERYGKRTTFVVPQRGDNVRLVELANKNAAEEVERITGKEERHSAVVELLGKMLGIEKPRRIESFDISNISGSDNVSAMVVFEDAMPLKNAYRRFKIDLNGMQDDYQSMRETLTRRLTEYINGRDGFSKLPDLWLIDGGMSHAQVAESVLKMFQLNIPVFGMVKDDRHRTRALIRADGMEIGIDTQPSVFAFIGNIQEETHRFAISYHRKLRSKRLNKSELDQIQGVGPSRKEQLLKRFSSVKAIREASLQELEHFLPKNVAWSIYTHFHNTDKE